ncbi:4-nitrophenylphosphatase/Acid phosphatase, partial [Scytalidium lignicola]
MATLEPRGPYSNEELKKLYPEELQLQLVQVLLRHGERSPVSPRFQNAGLAPFWPYCAVARSMVSSTLETKNSEWSSLQWRRRLETFGKDNGPVIASGPQGEIDAICNLGELTDKGRETTSALGRRLRHLYVDQLGFLPETLEYGDMLYLRATPIPRALESLQQAFWGLYPARYRSPSLPPVHIITRAPSDETLFPNDGNCRRFAQLSRAFAQRTADRWNNTSDMDYLNKLIGKWMPEYSKKVAVDSHPRLSGIMDTINSTISHGSETRLPKEFYDPKGREIIEKIGVEEWFSGYKESQEYRSLGIGGLLGDVVSRMVGSAEHNTNDGQLEVGVQGQKSSGGIKLGLSGCHDTTLAATLASLGAFDGEKWPPYTSHIAFELFKDRRAGKIQETTPIPEPKKGWFEQIFTRNAQEPNNNAGIARRKIDDLKESEKAKLDNYYVRLRYNDKVMKVPGCGLPGNHLQGDETFCTLEAFKRIVDKFTPSDWKAGCRSNMDTPPFPAVVEPAGY